MDWRLRTHRRHAFHQPGHAHELTFTCYRRFPFLRERTCQWLAEAVGAARSELDFALWAYVFMPEHVHLVVYPHNTSYDIARILSAIKEPVGRQGVAYLEEHSPHWLERITFPKGKRERRFWQAGGGYDRNVTDAKTLFLMIDYVHHNPVRRGLVTNPTDWKWSSAG